MKISGTSARPRLSVYRSLKHIRVQLIDDTARRTLLAVNDSELKKSANKVTAQELAYNVGKLVAERAIAAGITTIVFDRGGYAYHGRVKAVAEGARAGGLKF